mgnify:CR=1 FL=1
MNQCRNCGAPIARNQKSRECEYCGQYFSFQGSHNLFLLSSRSFAWLGSGFVFTGRFIRNSSRDSFKRINNLLSFKSQNANRRIANFLNRRNVIPIISVTTGLIFTGVYIKNFSQINQKIVQSGDAIKDKVFSFNSCNANYSTSKLIALTKPGVVRVISKNGSGSGFVVSHLNNKTFLLTNSHVVDGNSQVRVSWSDGEEDIADVVLDTGRGVSPTTDLALLKIKGKEGKVLKLQKKKILIGSDVIAVGDPEGFEYSFTKGIVSAIRDNGKAIQHDAAINPGNSGGPLLNSKGEVIGINTLIRSGPGAGLSFAIPINKVKEIVNELLINGKVIHPMIGISLINETSLDTNNIKVKVGYVVPKSPAAKSGILVNDIILKVEKEYIYKSSDVVDAINQNGVNKFANILIERNNRLININVRPIDIRDLSKNK